LSAELCRSVTARMGVLASTLIRPPSATGPADTSAHRARRGDPSQNRPHEAAPIKANEPMRVRAHPALELMLKRGVFDVSHDNILIVQRDRPSAHRHRQARFSPNPFAG
jgi:hypothetical protein